MNRNGLIILWGEIIWYDSKNKCLERKIEVIFKYKTMLIMLSPCRKNDSVFESDTAGADTTDPLIHFSRALRKDLRAG